MTRTEFALAMTEEANSFSSQWIETEDDQRARWLDAKADRIAQALEDGDAAEAAELAAQVRRALVRWGAAPDHELVRLTD